MCNIINIDEIMSRLGIEKLSPMQKKTIEAYDGSKDIVLLSPTGSGKTLAYLLPLLNEIDVNSDCVQSVVMVPSRELAKQVDNVIKSMKTPVRSICCYGGRPAMEEHRGIVGVRPHVVIATPGRLVDHLTKENIETESIVTLVIDEFDKCLEFGFKEEMSEAISMMPMLRRRFLLSATDAEQIPAFVNFGASGEGVLKLNYLSNDAKKRVSLHIVNSPTKDKLDTLKCLLRTQGDKYSVVFLNYRDAAERVYKSLLAEGFHCELFHGGLEQEYREKALYKFCNGTSNIFVSTDLGARGLDFPDVDNIIHYHLPLNEEAYIHRNGRTARWESEGNSFIIMNEDDSVPEYLEVMPDEFFIPKKLPEISLPLWATIYIGKGKKNKLNKVDVVGFLCKIGGLESKDIGRIDVREHYTFVAVNRKKLHNTLSTVHGQKIKGMKTIIQEAR